jgi:Phosphoribosyl transferase domain
VIFIDEQWENGATIQFVGNYQVYWLRNGQKNPKFDPFSGYILDVKKSYTTGLLYFAQRINPLVARDVVICCVPSHDATKTQSGIRTLAQRLALSNRVDATHCLVRASTVPKAAHGGKRSVQIHLDSIRVNDPELIRDKEILLLDDVTTTGSSLVACQKLLIDAGARRVKCLALGKTAPHE